MNNDLNPTLAQNMIALSQSPEMVDAMFAIIKRSLPNKTSLIGENEFQTLVNAVELETSSGIIQKVYGVIDFIKKGGLQDEAVQGKQQL